jgi:tricorn protease
MKEACMPSGYYRFPTLYQDTVVFTCEDDLWTAPVTGGYARRLTSGLGEATRPTLSPDGNWLAFAGREDGQTEIYVMPAEGGQPTRLTYLGGTLCYPTGWTADGQIIFANNARQYHPSLLHLYTISPQGGAPELINVGPARSIAYGPYGALVLGRNVGDPARWKRYRGGTAGTLWINPQGTGEFRPLIELKGNLASPMWLAGRVYFLSDHEGVGNLYSCLPDGADLQRHTRHADYYARNAMTDGQRIVYHAGADLYLFSAQAGESERINFKFHSPQTQRNRKFVDPTRYLESYDLHPNGQALAVSARGKLFNFANWEGAVLQHAEDQIANDASGSTATGIRYRLPTWLREGKAILAVSDAGGEEHFLILSADGLHDPLPLPDLDAGRVVEMAANPHKPQVAFSNHRHELCLLDLESQELKVIDRGRDAQIGGFDWSPDGEWLAYSASLSLKVSVLKLWHAATGEITQLTRPVLLDVSPSFDPKGRYLYFLSYRTFDPVYDNLQFDLNFPFGVKPYAILLQKDAPSPFIPQPKLEDSKRAKKPQPEPEASSQLAELHLESGEQPTAETEVPPSADSPAEREKEEGEDHIVLIDLEGIQDRMVAFPMCDGRYRRIVGMQKDKVIYSSYPAEGALDTKWYETEPAAKGSLWVYDLEDQTDEVLFRRVTDFKVAMDRSTLVYQSGYKLRVVTLGEKVDEDSDKTRKTGWVDLKRMRVAVTPKLEWRQMFREAWRLQRDHFWTPDMSGVDWLAVHDRYLPLVDRVSSRGEFSDLMWEMQGELSTSHCYEVGGDYRPQPVYPLGSLAASYAYDPERGGWRITGIALGDAWDPQSDSPLRTPGANVKVGDVILSINGQRLSADFSPEMALVNLANTEVTLTLAGKAEEDPRNVTVKTLSDEFPVRYRQWVESNREKVHAATQGRIGYLHIPDMGPRGYAEFHRYFLAEIDRDGLIVDVRFNGGGHVSALILQKLARKRIAYDIVRWLQDPEPYPPESVLGPIVALTNEQAGSDGDIFSHGFKLLGLGPLLGKRTWGGVVGIWPRHALVDGTITTQPEYSFWFQDVGWGVENYGTDPDIEVDILPQDYARGVDTQLERAIVEAVQLLETNPPRRPDFGNRPDLSLPKLS